MKLPHNSTAWLGEMVMTHKSGSAILSDETQLSLYAYAKTEHSVVIAEAKDGMICESIRLALAKKDKRECLLSDIAERMQGRYLVVFGVDPTNMAMQDTMITIKALFKCSVMAVLDVANVYECEDALTKLYANILA